MAAVDNNGVVTPNPGSIDALKMGCLCAIYDNHHGQGIPWPRADGKQYVTSRWYVRKLTD